MRNSDRNPLTQTRFQVGQRLRLRSRLAVDAFLKRSTVYLNSDASDLDERWKNGNQQRIDHSFFSRFKPLIWASPPLIERQQKQG
ncbi:MAG TPA: hypothetical protein VL134_11845 [Leptolyngbya sp.]|nr:hypothetical protein [Leptolyngbya sp.]